MATYVLIRMSRGAAALAVVALLAVPASSSAVTAKQPVAPCTQFAASPRFASDGVAFCAGIRHDSKTGDASGLALFGTTDGGRTWKSLAASGIAIQRATRVFDLLVSATYATDQTLVLQAATPDSVLGRGSMFTSTDGGATFNPTVTGGWGRLTSYVGAPPTGGTPRWLVVEARNVAVMYARESPPTPDDASLVIDPATGVATPVSGSGGTDVEYAFSPTFATDGIAFVVGVTDRRRLYHCDATLSCDEPLYTFADDQVFDRMWLAPDFAVHPWLFVNLRSADLKTSTLWWSHDGGHTFSRWRSAERLTGTSSQMWSGLAMGPVGTRDMYLRVTGDGDTRPGAPPYERLYVSHDSGVSWRLAAFGRTKYQPGARGTMPPNPPRRDENSALPRGLLTVAGTRIFTLGETFEGGVPYQSFFCSADRGRTWGRTC